MGANQPFIVNAEETRGAKTLDIFGNQIWIKLSGADTDGKYTVFQGEVAPQSGPPLHRHGREDECFHVLEGDFVFEVEGTEIYAKAGSTVFAPRGLAHRFQNVGTTMGRLLTVSEPAGLDDFFTEIDQATGGALVPDPAVVVPIFEKYGLELLGLPMAARRTEQEPIERCAAD